MNDSKCLLVLKTAQHLSKAQIESLTDLITPTAEALGAEPMVLGSGFDVELRTGTDALLERVCVALEALVKQGEPPEVSEAQIAPQALNARPTGLNTREAVCKGAWELGTACGHCSRCEATRPIAGVQPDKPWPRT
jgi:hypothetical protein